MEGLDLESEVVEFHRWAAALDADAEGPSAEVAVIVETK